MNHRKLFIVFLAASAMALPALAQPQRPAPTSPSEARQASPVKSKRLAQLRRRLLEERVGLTAERAAAVEAIVADGARDRRAAQRELAEARATMRALFASDSDDQEAWAAALAKLKRARDGLERLRDEEHAAIARTLSPKEQAKLLRAMQRVSGHLRAGRRQRMAPEGIGPDEGGRRRRGKPPRPR